MDKAFQEDIPFEVYASGQNKGTIKPNSQVNVRLALGAMEISLTYDEFAGRHLCAIGNGRPQLLDDALINRLWLEIDNRYRFRPARDFFIIVLTDNARQHSFHPVRDYLAGLKWDGVKRLDDWLHLYGNAESTPYIQAVGMLTLVAAVRRVRQPGCKFDEMLVLESGQGKAEKSSAIAALCPDENWFSDDLPLNMKSKEVIEQSGGRWIIECAELDGLKRGEVEQVKAILSRQVDKARLSYDRVVSERPRQFILMGTTNASTYLRDSTGNRRFWPVKIQGFKLDEMKRDRDQLWAEAAEREATGQSIRLDKSLWSSAAKEQEERLVIDPWEDQIIAKIGDQKGKILTSKVFDFFQIDIGQQSQAANERMGDVMQNLGFERVKLSHEGKTRWHYARGNKDERKQQITEEI